MTSSGSASYVYDAESRITSSAGVTYTYDGDGKRVKKSNGTLYWTGVGSDPLAESDLSGNITREFTFFSGKRIARRDVSSGNIHYYFSDHLGSADIVTNASGTIENESDYYPFGGERVVSQSVTDQNYKFTGKERDAESGLDYFGARYYSSLTSRWLTPDWSASAEPVPYADFEDPQSLNQYGYVRNNPMSQVDKDGHDPLIGGILGAGAGAGYILFKTGMVYFTGKGSIPTSQDTANAIATGFVIGATLGAGIKGVSTDPSPNEPQQDKKQDQEKPEHPANSPTPDAMPSGGDNSKTGTIYKVPGEATQSGKPYVGRHNQPDPSTTRKSNDGRDRTKSEVVDRYNASDTQEGRTKEQQHIDKHGLNNLDNKRNEIRKEKKQN